MLNTFRAKDGNLTAEWNGVLLHSSYSPLREVKKFLDSSLVSNARTAIIMGDPLGLITRETLNRNPGIKIIQISYDLSFSELLSSQNIPRWDPGLDQSLYHFLSLHLNDQDLIHLKLLSWTPSAKVFSELSEKYTNIINQFIRERKGSLFTTGGFGKKWLRNSLKNYLGLSRPSILSLFTGKPIFLAASGFSLIQNTSLIKKYRRKFSLWALPSAVHFLLDQGIVPDLIIQTDPGFYTRYHLRIPEDLEIPLAMPLSSSLEYNQLNRPVFLFSQGHFFEAPLLDTFGKSYITLSSTGTVAATAIQLGFLSRPPYFFVGGLDLISYDVHEHVCPNGFLPFLHHSSQRISPILTKAYDRVVSQGKRIHNGWQTEQLRTYTEWLNRFLSMAPPTLFRVNPSVIPLEGIRPIKGEDFADLLSSNLSLEDNFPAIDCFLTKETKQLNIEILLDFFISSIKKVELSGKTLEHIMDPHSIVYKLFSYLALPNLISYLKDDSGFIKNHPASNFSDISEKTIAILEELKQDFLS